jgi:hypothetical protein
MLKIKLLIETKIYLALMFSLMMQVGMHIRIFSSVLNIRGSWINRN